MKMEREFLMGRGSLRKYYIQVVVAAHAAFLKRHALILEKGERFIVLAGDAIDRQSPRKLERQNAFRSGFRAQTHAGGGIHRLVGGDRGLEEVVQRVKRRWRNGKVRSLMRSPDIVERFAVDGVKLPEKEWLVPLRVKYDIERAGGRTFEPGIKAGLRVGRKPVKKNAQGVAGIELRYGGIPLCADGSIGLGREIRGAELAKKFGGGIVRETEITVDEFLIEDGRAEKTPHLLLFDGIARDRENVTAPGKNSACNPAIERGEKGDRTLFKGENGIASAQLDVIRGGEAINIGGIDAQRPDRIIQFVR